MVICINMRWEEKLYISAFAFSSKCFGLLTETLFTCKTFAFTQETLEMNTLWVNAKLSCRNANMFQENSEFIFSLKNENIFLKNKVSRGNVIISAQCFSKGTFARKYKNIDLYFFLPSHIVHHHFPLRQWSQTQFLEGHSSVQFSSISHLLGRF